jgi:hypothetical protein
MKKLAIGLLAGAGVLLAGGAMPLTSMLAVNTRAPILCSGFA